MPETDYEQLARRFEEAVARSKRATQLAFICVIVAVIVMVIDNSIKRHIIAKSNEARVILHEFEAMAGQVMNGRTTAQPGPDTGGGADLGDGGDAGGVQPAPAAGAVLDQPGGDAEGAAGAGRAGGAGGPRGHG